MLSISCFVNEVNEKSDAQWEMEDDLGLCSSTSAPYTQNSFYLYKYTNALALFKKKLEQKVWYCVDSGARRTLKFPFMDQNDSTGKKYFNLIFCLTFDPKWLAFVTTPRQNVQWWKMSICNWLSIPFRELMKYKCGRLHVLPCVFKNLYLLCFGGLVE